MKKFNIQYDGMNQMVLTCFNGYFNNLNAITPEYLQRFIDYLKNIEEKTLKSSN